MESTTPDGDVAGFIERRGDGVMIISWNIDKTRDAVCELSSQLGYPFIPDKRGEVARAFRDGEFAFVHPKKLNGVLSEIIDCKSS
jgi:methylmalonyl-CoA/ethylmalonyl-CoA epimerase